MGISPVFKMLSMTTSYRDSNTGQAYEKGSETTAQTDSLESDYPTETDHTHCLDKLTPPTGLLTHPLIPDPMATPTYPTIQSNIEVITTPIELDMVEENDQNSFLKLSKDKMDMTSFNNQYTPLNHPDSPQSSCADNSFSLWYDNDTLSVCSSAPQELEGEEEREGEIPSIMETVTGADGVWTGEIAIVSNEKEKMESVDVTPENKPALITTNLPPSTKKCLYPKIALVRSPYKFKGQSSSPLEPDSNQKRVQQHNVTCTPHAMRGLSFVNTDNEGGEGADELTLDSSRESTNQIVSQETSSHSSPITSSVKKRRKRGQKSCFTQIKKKSAAIHVDTFKQSQLINNPAAKTQVSRSSSKKTVSPLTKPKDASISGSRKRKATITTNSCEKDNKKRRSSDTTTTLTANKTPAKSARKLPGRKPGKSQAHVTSTSNEKTTHRGGDSSQPRGGVKDTPTGRATINGRGSGSDGATNIEGEGKKRKGRPPMKKRRSNNEMKEDNYTPSTDWKCKFCNHGDNHDDLGYLYGPYRVGDGQSTSPLQGESGSGSSEQGKSSENSNERVVWVHVGCAYWSPGVCLVGDELKGLEDAIVAGENMVCQSCGGSGAVLCCDIRTCRGCYHYPCAVEKGCTFNNDQFTITCSKHLPANQATTPPR